MNNELFAKWQKMGIKTQGAPPKVEEKKVAFVPTKIFNPPAAKPVEKRKTGTDEMLDIMAKKSGQAQTLAPKEQAKKRTYLDEMKEIMASKGEVPQTSAKAESVRKTYLDEMKQTMASRAAPVSEEGREAEVVERSEESVEVNYREVKEAVKREQVNEEAVESEPKSELKRIEEDEKMRGLKEMLEARIRFAQGDTLELKKKAEPVSEELPVYQPEILEASPQEAYSADYSPPLDNAAAPEACQRSEEHAEAVQQPAEELVPPPDVPAEVQASPEDLLPELPADYQQNEAAEEKAKEQADSAQTADQTSHQVQANDSYEDQYGYEKS